MNLDSIKWGQKWLQLTPEDWQTSWPNYSSDFWSAPKKVSLNNRERSLLNQALHRLMKNPQDWGAHIIAWLYRRDYPQDQNGPEWWQQIRERLIIKDSCLEILPPINNFRVTYLVPTYNRIHSLKRTVAAIQAQTHGDWELIICDDASTDQTPKYLNELCHQDDRIRTLKNQENRGLGYTWSRLCRASTTELVACCADDDWLYPQHLEYLQAYFRQYPWIGMSGGGIHIVSPEGRLLRKHGPYFQQDGLADPIRELQRCGLICPVGPGIIHRKSLLKKWASEDILINEQKDSYAGWDYLLTVICLSRHEVAISPKILSFMEGNIQSEYQIRDNSLEFIYLLRKIIQEYTKLMGCQSYPWALAERFLNQIKQNIKALHDSASSSQALELTHAELKSLCSISLPQKGLLVNPYSDLPRWQNILNWRLIHWRLKSLPKPPHL